jgi:hypothetical protein
MVVKLQGKKLSQSQKFTQKNISRYDLENIGCKCEMYASDKMVGYSDKGHKPLDSITVGNFLTAL